MGRKKKKKPKAESPSPADSSPRPSSLRVNFEAVCQAVILALFCRTFVAEAYKIPTASMEPTLLIGDHLVQAPEGRELSIRNTARSPKT